MGGESPGVDFALVGHPESWVQVQRMMDTLRRTELGPLGDTDLREIFPWIPARTVERLTITSCLDDRRARGVYIETFIAPDALDVSRVRSNLAKVQSAIRCAVREGARVATLGGFTSIVLEHARRDLDAPGGIALTTGNTLTAGLIVRGVERASDRLGVDLGAATVLILGSTGDLGTACASYFARRVRRLCLSARRVGPLREQAARLADHGADVWFSTDPTQVLPSAGVVIAVASLAAPALDPRSCKPGALVCDAGYPKNLSFVAEDQCVHVFWGGMGRARRGWTNDSAVGDSFYRFPAPGIAHGCMLEGMVLGLEGRFEPFSQGRGNITEARMEEILNIAERHGIVPAPLFNAQGLWHGEVVEA
jgi:predicted amino acid dehydrogenase